MNTFLKLSLMALFLPVFLSNAMEGLGISEPEQPDQESNCEAREGNQNPHEQDISEIIEKAVEKIENYDHFYFRDLEKSILEAINQFKDEDKKELTQRLIQALTKQPILIKIRKLQLRRISMSSFHDRYIPKYIYSLFNDNIIKFNPAASLKKNNDEESPTPSLEIFPTTNPTLLITDLPQEILAYILTLGLAECRIQESQKYKAHPPIIPDSLNFISDVSNVCSTFYMVKGILLKYLKEMTDQKLLSQALLAVESWNYTAQILAFSNRVNINEFDCYNQTILMRAIDSNNKKLAQFLLNAKADTEIKDDFCGNTALMRAIKQSNPEFVKLLLKYNANLNQTNNNGKTALQLATELTEENPNNPKTNYVLQLIETAVQQLESGEAAGQK